MNDAASMAATERSVLHSDDAEATSALATALGQASRALETAVGIESPLVARLRALRGRLQHERLQIAVLGQFKRGKSTFINALLGAAVLPTGVLPLTAVATFIAWRRQPRIVVGFTDGQSREFDVQTVDEIRNILFRFVAEAANPENRLGVARVDLFYPADILVDGTVIIDTPGVGSTLRHNTDAAMQVLAESDAALFVVSADPPITEVEIEFLRRVTSTTARIFFVLNKTDYLRADEQRDAAAFLKKVLEESALIARDGKILCVSARDGLDAKLHGDARAQETSGLAALEDHVVRALANGKRDWLEEAVRGKTAGLLAQASAELGLRTRSLEMPIEELTAKAAAFQDALRSIEEQRRITRDLLAGDHRRLREALDERINELRQEIAARLVGVIDENLRNAAAAPREGTIRRALSVATDVEFDVARELLVEAFATEAGAALRACQKRVDMLIDRVRQTAARIFDMALETAAGHEPFVLAEDPYWVTESNNATLIPDPARWIDRLLPPRLRRRRLRLRMIRQANELTIRNAENLRWAIVRGLDETFRKSVAQFEERLDEAIRLTRDVIEDVLARRRDRSLQVKAEVERLTAAAASIAALRDHIASGM